MDFIQLPSCNGYKYVLVMVCMLFHWTEASSVTKALLEKITLSIPGELFSNLIVIEEPILLCQMFQQGCVLFDWSYNVFSKPSGLVKCT